MLRRFFVALLTVGLSSGPAFAGAGDYAEYQRILDSKCSQCHQRERIEQAIARGDNFAAVIEKMLRFGANLSAQERQVLGVFWQGAQQEQLAKTPIGATVTADPLGQFRAVLKSRCTGCHGLEQVEAAMAQGRPLDDLIEMMRKRGAIVTEADKNALAPFWGSPYKAE